MSITIKRIPKKSAAKTRTPGLWVDEEMQGKKITKGLFNVGYRWMFDVKPKLYSKRVKKLRKLKLKFAYAKVKKEGRRTIRLFFKKMKDAKSAATVMKKKGGKKGPLVVSLKRYLDGETFGGKKD